MSLPTREEIRETIDQSGCDLFAFFEADKDPGQEDRCYIHSISHQDTELLAMNIRRSDTPAIAGLITTLMSRWKSQPVQPGETCLAIGCNLMLTVVKPDDAYLDQIMDETVRSAVAYRGNKDFSVLILVPVRQLTDEEVKRVTALH